MRKTLILTLLSAGALIAFTAVPAALFDSGTAGVSASAKSINLNSSRSNIYKTKPKTAAPKSDAGHRRGDPAGRLTVSPEQVRSGDQIDS